MKYPQSMMMPCEYPRYKQAKTEKQRQAVLFDVADLDKRVAYIKVAGQIDAGCNDVQITMDFTLCGVPLVYFNSTKDMLASYDALLKHTKEKNPDIIILEITDGNAQKGIFLSCTQGVALHDCLSVLDAAGIALTSINGFLLDDETASHKMTNEMIFKLNELIAKQSLNHYLAVA